MTSRDFSDETLMRFADGELDDETSARLVQAMETDEALAARAALFVETRAAAQGALKPLLDEPIPDQLVASVERMIAERRKRAEEERPASTVVPFPAPAPARASRQWFTLPLAASIAAVVGGLGGYLLATGGEPPRRGLDVAGMDSPALGEALATVASGEELRLPGSNERFRAIATFRDHAQALCREFEVDTADRTTVISVACLSEAEWNLRFAVVAPAGDGSGYAPASSTEALDAYLAAIEAAHPMEAEEESEALREARNQTGEQP